MLNTLRNSLCSNRNGIRQVLHHHCWFWIHLNASMGGSQGLETPNLLSTPGTPVAESTCVHSTAIAAIVESWQGGVFYHPHCLNCQLLMLASISLAWSQFHYHFKMLVPLLPLPLCGSLHRKLVTDTAFPVMRQSRGKEPDSYKLRAFTSQKLNSD
jgi:hypothetical protein